MAMFHSSGHPRNLQSSNVVQILRTYRIVAMESRVTGQQRTCLTENMSSSLKPQMNLETKLGLFINGRSVSRGSFSRGVDWYDVLRCTVKDEIFHLSPCENSLNITRIKKFILLVSFIIPSTAFDNENNLNRKSAMEQNVQYNWTFNETPSITLLANGTFYSISRGHT